MSYAAAFDDLSCPVVERFPSRPIRLPFLSSTARFAGVGVGAIVLVIAFAAATGAIFSAYSHVTKMRDAALSGPAISHGQYYRAPAGPVDLSGLTPLPFSSAEYAELVRQAEAQAAEEARIAALEPVTPPKAQMAVAPPLDLLPPSRPHVRPSEKPADAAKPPAPRLAYALPQENAVPKARNPVAIPGYEPRTAIYDIEAHTVYMPNGERLEAHSGLGSNFDDPGSVRLKNRGVTPPNVYNLTMREALFHGVAAIRLNPVNAGAMFGRDGMLAHTYMLGPRGDSNGCVSFKDYARFLAAFQRGEVTRLVVVTRLSGGPPAQVASAGNFFKSLFGGGD